MIGGQSQAPLAVPPKSDPVPNAQDARWAQSRFGRVKGISSQPVFEPQTAQAVASLCTDWKGTRYPMHRTLGGPRVGQDV
jgi:hypothetical protein